MTTINSATDESNTNASYLKWLNLQSPDWVLYSSFGSFFPVSAAQMDEIVTGLNKRGVSFLLVMQNETNRLLEICGDNGLFVEWCDQVSVLCHPRVGWFWSHCGWNSTKEAVLAAVLLLAFPIVMDQFLNANMIIEDWRIGLFGETRRYGGSCVEVYGHGESREGLRRNARKLREACESEFTDGGSFHSSVEEFTKSILQNG